MKLVLMILVSVNFIFANEEHEHDHHDEQEHEEIEISAEAEKNFEIKKIKFNSGSIELPLSAILTSGSEKNLFRYRKGKYVRIDFEEIKKNSSTIYVKSHDLNSGDEIVIQGLGFLRVAEIAATGGAVHGHSH